MENSIPAIDTEAHSFFRAFPPEAGFSEDLRKLHTWQERPGELLLAEMDHAGVELAFLISYDGWDMPYYMAAKGGGPESFWGGADYCRQVAAAHLDRLRWFVTLRDPRAREGLEPLQHSLAQGAHGIKVFPGFLETNIDDPALMEAYGLIHEHGGAVIFGFEDLHPPDTPDLAQVWDAFARVADAFPALSFQTNHFGLYDPRSADAKQMFDIVRAHPNINVSCACLQNMWEDGHEYPYHRYLDRLRALRDGVGAGQIVWGTDWPWLEHFFMYPQLVEAVRRHADFLSHEEKEQFLHRNARRFLGDRA